MLGEVVVNRYQGAHTPQRLARTVKGIEATLTTPFSLDTCLREVAEELPDGSDFSVLDLGSGSGAFLRALADPMQLPHFSRIINQRNLTIRALGLTDCPRVDLFNQADPEFRSPEINTEHYIANFLYTLHSSQTLEQFLAGKNHPTFNFIQMSQLSLFLDALLFMDTADTALTHLAANGRLLLIGVGLRGGPLPDFIGETAERLREDGKNMHAADINLLAGHQTLAHVEIPQLVLRKDWEVLKKRLADLVVILENNGLIQSKNAQQEVNYLLRKFKGIRTWGQQQQNVPKSFSPAETDPRIFRDLKDSDVQEAFNFYILINGAFEQMRERGYREQVLPKQAYLKNLLRRENITVQILRTLLNDHDESIDAVLIEKN